MRKKNIHHGPAFQNVVDSLTGANKAISIFNVSAAAQSEDQEYVLHPTTLDTIFQAFYVCVPEETKRNATVVPRSIRNMFIFTDLKRHPGEQLRAYTSLLKADRRGAKSNAVISNEDSGKNPDCSLYIEDFYFQGISRAVGDELYSDKTKLCAKFQWELDVLHDIPKDLKDLWKIVLDDAEVTLMYRVSYSFVCDAVAQLEGCIADDWQWHHKLLISWMTSTVQRGKSGKLGPGSQGWSQVSRGIKQRLIDDLAATNAAGRLTCRVGSKLSNIIRGELTPLELMMEDSLLYEYYQESPRYKDRSYKHLRELAELFGVKHPGANVLDIGAGTGGATMVVLEGLSARAENGSGTLLGHYDFTDVSSGFFEAARDKVCIMGKYDGL